MRTIKFRVWDKELKKYRSEKDGDYSLGVLSGKVRGIYGEQFPQMEVQQFTGLYDKNGKEIYEGDINQYGYVIKYCKEKALFGEYGTRNGIDYDILMSYPIDSKSQIIKGNIYENP